MNEWENLVRVLFLTAPFKRRMVECMAQEFSRLTYEIVTPGIRATSLDWAGMNASQKMSHELFGEVATLREVTRFEPDIIYTDDAYYGAQLKISSYGARKRIPHIVHLRGDWWTEFTGGLSAASWPRYVAATQHYAYNWGELVLARKVTPICKWLERVVRNHLPGKKTEVVYQGVDPSQYYENDGLEFRKPSVAIIQNHTVLPKVLGLLKFRPVVNKLAQINFYIAEGEHSNQQYLQLVKRTYSACRNVHFISHVDSSDAVRRMLTACDCYVLASGLDCCPTTVLEASLMRRPVIASRVGGVPEIVLENETGWTIDNESTDYWVEKINRAVTDSKLRRKFGNRGREWVSKTFGWKTIARQVEQLILQEAQH